MVDMRRSFFRMQPQSRNPLQFVRDIWRNKFLFWSISAGFFTIFPVLYIPVINDVVFKHKGISWEWGIVLVATVLFFLGIEIWKFLKRAWFRKQAVKRGERRGSLDLEKRTFERYLSTAVSTDDEKI